jgi:adenylate cyclase
VPGRKDAYLGRWKFVNEKSTATASTRIEATFAFIDMAGFTALTETRGDLDAADMATRFTKMARAVLEPGDRLVKSIGDAVLVTSPTAASGVALVERLFNEVANDTRMPALRAGLHHGKAVLHDGDVFGAAVNLAARVSAEAYAGEVLGTKPIEEAARDAGIPVAELGPVPLKNVRDLVPLYSLALVLGETDTPVDPVCQTPIDRRSAAGRLRYRKEEYWFCSLTCAAAFASNPGWHAAEAKKHSLRP